MQSSEPITRESQIKRSDKKRYYRADFSGLNLANASFRYATVIECNFTDANLSYANFENANCWGSDFTGANMYRTNMKDAVLASTKFHPRDCFGLTVTLTCDTVDKMDVNDKVWSYWLYMGTMFKTSDEKKAQLMSILGEEKYAALERLFKERQF